MNVVLFGSTGLLGQNIYRELKKSDHYIYEIDRSFISELRSGIVSIENVLSFKNVDLIINCISMNGINNCFRDKNGAIYINSILPRLIADLALKERIPCILFSSEAVFSDNEKLIDIHVKPEPCNFYGLTKLSGESSNKYTTVIRLPLLLAKRPNNQIVWKLIENIKNNKVTMAADNVYSSPIFVEDLSEKIVENIQNNKFREAIYHFSSEVRLSLYDTVLQFCRALNLPETPLIRCSDSDFPCDEPKQTCLGLKASTENCRLPLDILGQMT